MKSLNPFKPGRDGTIAECEMMFRELIGGRIWTDTKASPQEQLEIFRLVQFVASREEAA